MDLFIPNHFIIDESGPSGIMDLGSDHRVFRTKPSVQKKRNKYTAKKVSMKEWSPYLNADGIPDIYHQTLDENLDQKSCEDVEVLNQVIYEAATFPGVRSDIAIKSKPWQ